MTIRAVFSQCRLCGSEPDVAGSRDLAEDVLAKDFCRYGQLSATFVTVVTFRPSVPPTPIRRPVADIRLPISASNLVNRNLSAIDLSPSGRACVVRRSPRLVGALWWCCACQDEV